jgi:hypothetical protein
LEVQILALSSSASSRCIEESGFAVAVRQTGLMEAVDWALRDRRTGHIVVAQWPNTALTVWMAASVVRALFDPVGTWGLALRVVATVALSWWAADEVVRGGEPVASPARHCRVRRPCGIAAPLTTLLV